jgi:hypothetical protein
MLNIRSYLKYANVSQALFKFDFKSNLKYNGVSDYIRPDSETVYQKGGTKLHYKTVLRTSKLVAENELSLEKMSFISDKRNSIPDIIAGNKVEMGFFLNETYQDFKQAADLIKEMSIDYLNVKYMSEKTAFGVKYYVVDTEEGYKIRLEEASSGMQTVIPLSLIVEYFSKNYDFNKSFNAVVFDYLSQNDSLKDFRSEQNIGDIKHRNIHIHIEEPELSLYPESQRSMIDFIVDRCFIQKHNGYNMTVMMATHSPYIVNHLNLLIMAGEKGVLENGASLLLENVGVFEIIDGYLNDLKHEDKFIIDSRPLSEPISNIYRRYDQLKGSAN